MKTKLLSTVLGVSLLISSCSSELLVDEKMSGDFNSIKVPAGFNWNTSREVNFSIKIADVRFNNAKHVISIYSSAPKAGVNPISKGAASVSSPFNAKISVASSLKELYVVRTSPDGLKTTEKVSLDTSSQLNLVLGGVSSGRIAASDASMSSNYQSIVTETSPDCSTGCNTTIDENSSNKNLALDSKTICLTGSNYTVNVTSINPVGGGTIRVCGNNITINNLTLDGSLYYNLVVTTGASATLSNFSWGSANATIRNFGTLNIANTTSLGISGSLTNLGTINVDNSISCGTRSTVSNSGKINIKGSFTSLVTMTNNGEIVVDGAATLSLNTGGLNFTNNGNFSSKSTLTVNTNAKVTNNGYLFANNMQILNTGNVYNKCQLIVKNNLTIDNGLYINSYVSVGNNTIINGRAVVQLFNGSMFVTKTITVFDGHIDGQGANYSLFKVTGSSPNLTGGKAPKITGTIQYAEPSGTMLASHFDVYAKSTTGEGIYIAKTSCNEGNGTAPVVLGDTDNDGIIDAEDSYPNDASKAFDNYSTPSTVAFEDQWPHKGDYDLNDVVLSYNYQIVTNASNKVAHVKANYTLKAAGGSLQNGAGVQFNLPKGAAKNFVSTNGAELEAGQDSVVVLLFKQSGNELGGWNTISGKSVSSKSYSFSFDLVDGPSLSTFGLGSYNPFIWDNGSIFGQLRKETHFLGKYPTKLMNTKMFGTVDDASLTNKYFSTSNGLPWAIEVSTNDFKYPVEFISISSTYLKFADWASSGGILSTDWYSNPALRISANTYRAN